MQGVYILYNQNTVVYVGQSNCIEKRLLQHTDKIYDKVSTIECTEEKGRLAIETALINQHRPKYNGKRGQPKKEPTIVIRVQRVD